MRRMKVAVIHLSAMEQRSKKHTIFRVTRESGSATGRKSLA